MKYKFSLIFILVIIYSELNAYNISPLYDLWKIIKSPFSTRNENLLRIGIFSGITASLLILDNDIQSYVQKNKDNKFADLLYYSQKMGEGEYIIGVSGILLLIGWGSKNYRLIRLGIYSLEGFLISGIIVTTTKFIIGRARPYMSKGTFYFKPFEFSTGYKSFYSGHTTVAFTFASTIAHFTKELYLSIILYTGAALTGIARIYYNKHWSSDVFVGAITGILIGKYIIESNEPDIKLDTQEKEINITLWKDKF